MRKKNEKTCQKVKPTRVRRNARGLRGGKEGCITLQKSACGGKSCKEFCKGVYAELWQASSTPRRGAADLIASRIPPGRIDWVVGGRVVFFVLVVFSVFYVFVGLVAVLGCLLVVWLLGCWFEQPNNPKKQPPNNPMIRQPSYQTTQEHNNPTTQTNRFLI